MSFQENRPKCGSQDIAAGMTDEEAKLTGEYINKAYIKDKNNTTTGPRNMKIVGIQRRKDRIIHSTVFQQN